MPSESSTVPAVASPVQRILQRKGTRQLIKFCIVGFSSTVVDKGVLFALLSWTKSNAPDFPWWGCAMASFCLAVTNGYVWNRRWTFQALGQGNAQNQYAKFVVSNVIGLGLNLVFTKIFLVVFTGKVALSVNPDPKQVMLASLCAVPCVVIWNFTIAKFWTFRKPK